SSLPSILLHFFFLLFFFLMLRLPPTSTLFPYTTLFRSCNLVLSSETSVTEPGMGCPVSCASITRLHHSICLLYFSIASLATSREDRKSTRLNSSHVAISYAVFCLKKKNKLDNTYIKLRT